MPKTKNYPKWFSPYFPPTLTQKPLEVYKHQIESDVKEFNYGDEITADYVGMTLYSVADYDGTYAKFVRYTTQDVPNKDYKKQLDAYRKEVKIHAKQLGEWKILKEKWDKEQAEETKIFELKQLEKLKKKYEK